MTAEHTNGGEPMLAPKRRITPVPFERLSVNGEEPSIRQVVHAVETIGANVHHNIGAIADEFEDVHAGLRLVGQAATAAVESGSRIEAKLGEVLDRMTWLGQRLEAVERRLKPGAMASGMGGPG